MTSQTTPTNASNPASTSVRPRLFTHLWYATRAEEAARLYVSIFPDSYVHRVTPIPVGESEVAPAHSLVIVDFTLMGQRFQALQAGPHHEFNDAISLVVLCEDQAEIDRVWEALLEGGGQPQACGWLIDKFGLRWQVVPTAMDDLLADPDPAAVARVTQAMMPMVKLDLAALEAARNGT